MFRGWRAEGFNARLLLTIAEATGHKIDPKDTGGSLSANEMEEDTTPQIRAEASTIGPPLIPGRKSASVSKRGSRRDLESLVSNETLRTTPTDGVDDIRTVLVRTPVRRTLLLG